MIEATEADVVGLAVAGIKRFLKARQSLMRPGTTITASPSERAYPSAFFETALHATVRVMEEPLTMQTSHSPLSMAWHASENAPSEGEHAVSMYTEGSWNSQKQKMQLPYTVRTQPMCS